MTLASSRSEFRKVPPPKLSRTTGWRSDQSWPAWMCSPANSSSVPVEQLLQRVQEQALAEAPRPRQEVVCAFVEQALDVGRLVDVIAVLLPQRAEGLHADRQSAPGHRLILRKVATDDQTRRLSAGRLGTPDAGAGAVFACARTPGSVAVACVVPVAEIGTSTRAKTNTPPRATQFDIRSGDIAIETALDWPRTHSHLQSGNPEIQAELVQQI